MLRNDDEKSVFLIKYLALQRSKSVMSDVEILRSKCYKAAFRQLACEIVIRRVISPVTTSCGRPSSPCWQTTTGRFSPQGDSWARTKIPYANTSGKTSKRYFKPVQFAASCVFADRGLGGNKVGQNDLNFIAEISSKTTHRLRVVLQR